mmetsp:Transcript_44598/g.80198  ORF Transcript_44598/g.80198 Transcript_44598/m.80198 type:complete len:268 (+) Transcript_44598:49-852(+)
MYLKTVLQGLGSKKTLDAEDLYKLNEATFNMPEEDTMDEKMTAKLYSAVEKAVAAYSSGKFDKGDSNFLYDYVALLGTMQNQHFFSQKQNQAMLGWLKDALGQSANGKEEEKKLSQADVKAMNKLTEDNRKLAEELTKLKELSAAVLTLKTIKLPEADSKGKGKSPAAGKTDAAKEAKPKAKAENTSEANAAPVDPVRKELKAQINAAGRALAKKKREVIEKYGIEPGVALDHEEVQPMLLKLKELKEQYAATKKPEDETPEKPKEP